MKQPSKKRRKGSRGAAASTGERTGTDRTRTPSPPCPQPDGPVQEAAARREHDPWNWLAGLFLLLGLSVQLFVSLPPHKYLNDSDGIGTGLWGLGILHGHFPVFYSGVRLGAFPAYAHVPFLALLGPSRGALVPAPVLTALLQLVAFLFLARSLCGRVVGTIALLFMAIPPAAYLFWTYVPVGYVDSVLFATLTIWLAARQRVRGAEWLPALCLGIAAGLGFWNNALTVASTAGCLLWLGFRRGSILVTPRFAIPATLGFLAGSLPWIAFNVQNQFASLRQGYGSQPATGLTVILENARYLSYEVLPWLFLDGFGTDEHHGFLWWATALVLLAALGAATWSLIAARNDRENREDPQSSPEGAGLLLLVSGLACALFVFSAAGSLRGPVLPVRYLVLIVPAAAVFLAKFCTSVWNLSRPMAVAIALVPLLHNLAGYGSLKALNVKQLEQTRAEEGLIGLLKSNRVSAVVGSYWEVEPVNLLAWGQILAYSYDPSIYLPIREEDLPAAGVRWALVGTPASPIRKVAESVGLPGTWVRTAGFEVFVLEESATPPSREFLRIVRAAAAALNAGP